MLFEIFGKKTMVKCTLDMFNMNVKINDDTWNKIKQGEVFIELKDKNDNHQIGYINYRKYIGQLGLLFITDKKYINRGLGTQLVNFAIEDMKTVATKEVWLVTRDNHPFWSKHMNFTKREPAHFTVTGSGYYKKI